MEKKFDPNAAAPKNSGIFGLPYSVNEAKLVLLPVPWEATTSYGGGTSLGPKAILEASRQVDLFDLELRNFYEEGIALLPFSKEVLKWNQQAKKAAQKIINVGGAIGKNKNLISALKLVNELSGKVNEYAYKETKKYLDQDKIVGMIGGDHSCPLGVFKAYLEKYPKLGILHIDAHADLRTAYEGFKYSHASIMYNLIEETSIERLVQVGIRDFCQEEFDIVRKSQGRIHTFYDQILTEKKFSGQNWQALCDEIIAPLPNEVYISFDIDGLDPSLCPNTGTPVPGGLSYQEVNFLFKRLVKSGRKIVGFDLNEVSPHPDDKEWNANVGARLLYKLCGWALRS